MNTDLTARIERAVREGIEARHDYFAAIDLEDEQQLGPPAAARDLAQLEAKLNRRLPPSYRRFLELHDGWKSIDGGLDLLSVADLLGGPIHDKVHAWQQQMFVAGDQVAARSLVIGISSVTPTKYLLDPAVVDADGEWQFVQHHKVEEETLPSFLQWLEESVDEYRELASTEGNPPDDE